MGPAITSPEPSTEPSPTIASPEAKLTRQQRRVLERLNREADQTFNSLFEKFFEFFIESEDPQGQEVTDKLDHSIAMWKLYCHRKRLNPKVYGMMEQHCAGVVKEYLDSKRKKEIEDKVL